MFVLTQRWCSLQDSGDLSGKCHWSLGLFSRRILAIGLGVREIKLVYRAKNFWSRAPRECSDSHTKTFQVTHSAGFSVAILVTGRAVWLPPKGDEESQSKPVF